MRFPVRRGRPLFTALLVALSGLIALTVVPGARAHNASQSPCALRGATGYTDEGQQTNYTKFQNPLGTKRVGLLYVDFSDATGTGNIADYHNKIAPAADWMRNASYGQTRLDIQAPLNRWLRMPHPQTSYPWPPSYATQQRYVRDAAVAAASAGVDTSRYDMLYIVPTRNAKLLRNGPTYLWTPSNPVIVHGAPIKWAVTFGQDLWSWGPKVADHETSHTFGLPDLYAFNGALHGYVGGWDLMGNVGGPGPQYFGWHSWKFGMIKDDQVACLSTTGMSSRIRLSPVEYAGQPGHRQLVVLRTSATTAYVAESRRATLNDANLCSTGVLIYKVNSSTGTGAGPIRVVPNPSAPRGRAGCGTLDMATWHPGQTFRDPATQVRVAVVSADSGTDTVVASIGSPTTAPH